MKSTHDKVLQTIKAYPESTIVEIAEIVGINAISVRHHLTNLQADDLISVEEERHGIGRPRFVYSLTKKGEEEFPTRYYQLTNILIEQMKNMLPEKQVISIFQGMANKLTSDYKKIIPSLNIEDKFNLLKKIMYKEGFDFLWEKEEDKYIIHEISCPFYQVGQHHPEVCLFVQTIIANILSVPTRNVKHSKTENKLCKYTIFLNN